MKKLNLNLYAFILIFGVLASCQSSEAEVANEGTDIEKTTDQTDTIIEVLPDNESFLSLEKWNLLIYADNDYYILNYAGIAKEDEAIAKVESLKKNYPNAGYLWIPDFASLSGTEVFAVFLDQANGQSEILKSLENAKKQFPDVYAVRVSQNKERWTAYSSTDIRINGKRINTESQKIIFSYQSPQDAKDYEEAGGEDWGYFGDIIEEYFKKKHPEVKQDGFYYSDLSKEEIKHWENKLDLKSKGLGYILIDGEKSKFLDHAQPDDIISQACAFFGLKR